MSEPKQKKWQEFEFADTLPAGQTAFFSGDQWKAFWPKSFELLWLRIKVGDGQVLNPDEFQKFLSETSVHIGDVRGEQARFPMYADFIGLPFSAKSELRVSISQAPQFSVVQQPRIHGLFKCRREIE